MNTYVLATLTAAAAAAADGQVAPAHIIRVASHADAAAGAAGSGSPHYFPFGGIGALSGGGATSKLLPAYPEPQRSQVQRGYRMIFFSGRGWGVLESETHVRTVLYWTVLRGMCWNESLASVTPRKKDACLTGVDILIVVLVLPDRFFLLPLA